MKRDLTHGEARAILRYAARRMQGRTERFTGPKLDGVHLHGVHHGSTGRAKLVLLHGAGANAHWWDHLAPVLAEHFHVVALDFRGHGDSDHPEEHRPGAFGEDLAALVAHLAERGAGQACLVGHSLGAHVAAGHAARRRAGRGEHEQHTARGSEPREVRAEVQLSGRAITRARSRAHRARNVVPMARALSSMSKRLE